MADEHTDIERVVAYWGGSAAVRQRLHALARATASLVLFLEYNPQNLRDWLVTQVAAGQDAVIAACALLQRLSTCRCPVGAFRRHRRNR